MRSRQRPLPCSQCSKSRATLRTRDECLISTTLLCGLPTDLSGTADFAATAALLSLSPAQFKVRSRFSPFRPPYKQAPVTRKVCCGFDVPRAPCPPRNSTQPLIVALTQSTPSLHSPHPTPSHRDIPPSSQARGLLPQSLPDHHMNITHEHRSLGRRELIGEGWMEARATW